MKSAIASGKEALRLLGLVLPVSAAVTLFWLLLFDPQPAPNIADVCVELSYFLIILVLYCSIWTLRVIPLRVAGAVLLLGLYMDVLNEIFIAPDYVDNVISQGLQLIGVALLTWSTYRNFLLQRQKLDLMKDALAQMEHRATHDVLTGLPNRVLFHDRLLQALALAQRENRQLAVLYMDMDNLKETNDNFGHEAGDYLLQQSAQRLQSMVRESDTLARLGGDEFAIIYTRAGSVAQTQTLAQHLLEALDAPLKFGEQTFYPGASLGISLFPDHANTAQELLKLADSAMYEAKMMAQKPRIAVATSVESVT